MATLKWFLIVAFVIYGGVLTLMYVFQRSLLYFPDPRRTAPAESGLPQAQEVILTTSDGERLIAWTVAPQTDKPVVLYFHGNAGSLRLRADRFRRLTADGTGLVAMSYRGYSGSSGRPSEAGLVRDAAAAYEYAAAQYPGSRLAVWGESLGTAVAITLAAERPVAALILDAPFTSAVELGAAVYPFVPVRWLMKDTFRSDRRIAQVKAPILVLHGERDGIVPIGFGERLFALAPEPKRFVRFPNGGHVNLDDHGAQAAVRDFLAKL